MKKALKINVEKQIVESIVIKSREDIYDQIGNDCKLFQIPININGDDLYCDEEILLRPDDIKGGFYMPNWRIPILNNAIILGVDESTGNSCDCTCKISDFEQVKFLNAETCQEYAKRAMSIDSTIIHSY